jgi:hypothetical protein
MRLKVWWQLVQHSCMLLQDVLHILHAGKWAGKHFSTLQEFRALLCM